MQVIEACEKHILIVESTVLTVFIINIIKRHFLFNTAVLVFFVSNCDTFRSHCASFSHHFIPFAGDRFTKDRVCQCKVIVDNSLLFTSTDLEGLPLLL